MRTNGKQSKWDRRNVVAWDGEGANISLADGSVRQLYVLLANSKGQHVLDPLGLSTTSCLDFLCDNADEKDINVIFGGSYDANMMLADLPRSALHRLWTEGQCTYRDFYIRYTWRKCLTVKRRSKTPGRKWDGSITLWDVLGFFQATFVRTVESWLPDVDVDWLAEMKAGRGTFRLEDIDEIIRYCHYECDLLVRVCVALFDSFADADIRLTRFDGAGAVAAALLRAHKIDRYLGVRPQEVATAAQYAYAGGRIEAPKIGNLVYGAVYQYDINSAYPSAIRGLPCLEHGEWVYNKGWSPEMGPSVIHVEWDLPPDRPFYPFFYRTPDGRILYPRVGEGWYWDAEVRAALQYDRDGIAVLECWEWRQVCDERPFAWLDEVYADRLRFKAEGNKAEYGLKLGMNSVYGKMAQQSGWARTGKPPRYHCLPMAGMVTSETRAALYMLAMQNPEAIIAFCTDAVISTVPLECYQGSGLGEWTAKTFDGVTICQPGVYFLRNQGEVWASKFRGFDPGVLNREAIVGCWLGDRDQFEAEVTRFVGAGSALRGPKSWPRWRTWETTSRHLDLTPTGKRLPVPGIAIHQYSWQLVDTIPAPNMTPTVISTLYPLEWIEGIQGWDQAPPDQVPYNIIESEWVDSWS